MKIVHKNNPHFCLVGDDGAVAGMKCLVVYVCGHVCRWDRLDPDGKCCKCTAGQRRQCGVCQSRRGEP
jgi:hypothetical protein